MKKGIFLVLLIAVLAVGAFAQEFKMSAGGGGFTGGDFAGGKSMEIGDNKVTTSMPNWGYGAYGFFDATFVEASVGFFTGTAEYQTKYDKETTYFKNDSTTLDIQTLNIGILGKYPITVAEKFILFPMVGVEFQLFSSVKRDGAELYWTNTKEDVKNTLDATWIRAGIGGDIFFTDKIFMRISALYGIRLANKWESHEDYMPTDAKAELGHGLTARLAVGYKF